MVNADNSLRDYERIQENKLKAAENQYKNKETRCFSGFLKRRDRDSNPGYLSVQRFSRPPQSTTLPPLQVITTTLVL